MGVGTPMNIIENIGLGIDMFDCVMPTSNARNGMLFTSEGTINIKNEKWKNDHTVIDPNGNTFVDNFYTKAYLRHLFSINENLGKQIATIHNLGFYKWIIEKAKNEEIKKDNFLSWKNKIVNKLRSETLMKIIRYIYYKKVHKNIFNYVFIIYSNRYPC